MLNVSTCPTAKSPVRRQGRRASDWREWIASSLWDRAVNCLKSSCAMAPATRTAGPLRRRASAREGSSQWRADAPWWLQGMRVELRGRGQQHGSNGGAGGEHRAAGDDSCGRRRARRARPGKLQGRVDEMETYPL